MGYEYRGIKLTFEAALYQNGKIEFGYAPLDSYSTQYTLLKLSSDPVNVWKLDESTGDTVTDAQSNQNLTYKMPNQMRPTPGLIVSSSFFSGSSGYQNSNTLIFADDGSFANYGVTDSFSFSAWFKSAAGNSSTKTILSRMNYSDPFKGYSIQLAGGYLQLNLIQSYNTNRLSVQSSDNIYNDGEWHHVVCTYNGTADSSGVKIYVDGQTISTTVPHSSLTVGSNIQELDSSADFMIGGVGKKDLGINVYHFTGSIDDVARWNSVLNSGDVQLLYEKGLEAISAADIEPVGDSTTSFATCGIFASGSSTWNYRDFSPLLGSSILSRSISEFGGAVYTGSFACVDSETSTSAPYETNLGVINWPKHGGKIIFTPPQLRRRLIRSDAHEAERRNYFNSRPFDDRKTISYVVQDNVDASTILPHSVLIEPSYPGIHLKQNLMYDGGIKVPFREVLSAGNSVFLEDELENREVIQPFSETFLPEQGNNENSFYNVGTTSPIFGESSKSFSAKLSSKKSITLNFTIDKKTKMLSSASSIYYLNLGANQWNIPTSSLIDHSTSSFSKLSIQTVNYGIGGTCSGSFFAEDKIGFDSYGNSVVSGSLNIFRTSSNSRNQTIQELGIEFNQSEHINLLSSVYEKSIQRNSSYDARDQELFELPIDDPFLMEKAIIEIPFCLGAGWFNDKTTFLVASASNYAHTASGGSSTPLSHLTFFDEGGPSITVSLFCQKLVKGVKVRDLVFKSTFSHQDDINSTVEFISTKSGSLGQSWNAIVVGNKNNHNILDETQAVNYTSIAGSKTFTGSIKIAAIPSITNCAQIAAFKTFTVSEFANTGSLLTSFNEFMGQDYMTIKDSVSSSVLVGLDPFGRSMGGFSAGEEYSTTQSVLFGDLIANPFYISGSSNRQLITGTLESKFALESTGSYLYCISKLPIGKPKVSPYLVRPGDKLILAVSKSRPVYKSADIRINDSSLSTGKIQNIVSSSYYNNLANNEGHDVYLNTGSINIKFYGSNIKLRQENRPR